MTKGDWGHIASWAYGAVYMKVAAEQVCHLPLRPNTLEKSHPFYRWLPKLLAKAFCNILSLLATSIMTFIFALQTVLLWNWSLESASKSYLMNFYFCWNSSWLYNETTTEWKKDITALETAERIVLWKSAEHGSNIFVPVLWMTLSFWCQLFITGSCNRKLLLKLRF